MGATSTDHGHPTPATADLSAADAEALFERVTSGNCSPEDAELFRAQMLTEMAGMSLEDGLVMQIHPGSCRNHNPQLFERFGRDIGADTPLRTEYIENLRPLLSKYGNERDLSIILFTLDETVYSRELAPLAGHYPVLKLGPAWWFHDSPEGMRRFHRAHQAWYTDACLNARETGWAICGVSMRSDTMAKQLNPQGGLYTLTQRSGDRADSRLVGAVREMLVAGPHPDAIVARLASPECHIASFTVTEKGYCRRADGSLDFDRASDGFYPLLADALKKRAGAGLPGLTLLACDNLSGNGRILDKLLTAWLE
jgi:hypothetical protein